MKKGLLFTLVAALLLPMCLSLTAHAAVYLGTGDNVDSGGHLDWDYDTTYYSQTVWGMNLWNGYKSGVIRRGLPMGCSRPFLLPMLIQRPQDIMDTGIE